MMINRNKEVSGKEKGNKILVILLGASVLFIMIPAILYLANEGRKNTIYHENISQLHEDSIREADSIAAVAYAAASAAASVTDESSDSDIAAENIYDEYEETKYDTGDIPYLAYFGRGKFDYNSLSKLTLTNNSSADAVLLLVRILNGEIIRNVFVHNRKNYVIKNIPEGKYMIRVMYGNSWYKQKDNGDQFPKGGFMKNVSFSQSKENNPFDYIFSRSEDGISYPTYSLTLHKVLNGNMRTEKISKDDFFK